MIRADRFSKLYGDFKAVSELSFHVGAGSILGLIGPNGAGKTTTLRALAGIVRPSAGRLLVAGHDVSREPLLAKQKLGFVPDEPQLFDTLTVWEHLEFTASAYAVEGYRVRAQELLDAFSLSDKKDTMAQELSRGMRQKLMFVCTLLHQPEALLLDEPLVGLDPEAIDTVERSIRALASRGTAIVVSSHLLGLVEVLCTHLLILHLGERRLFGPMAEVLGAFDERDRDASLEEVFFSVTRPDQRAG